MLDMFEDFQCEWRMFLHTFYLYLQSISANFLKKIQVIPSKKKKKCVIYQYYNFF